MKLMPVFCALAVFGTALAAIDGTIYVIVHVRPGTFPTLCVVAAALSCITE